MRDVRQVPNDYPRRWFYDDHLDLVAWYKPDGSLHGFQLSYDKTGHEKALTWFATVAISSAGSIPAMPTRSKIARRSSSRKRAARAWSNSSPTSKIPAKTSRPI